MSGDHLAQSSTQSRPDLGKIAQSLRQLNVEYLQEWIIFSPSRQPFPVS